MHVEARELEITSGIDVSKLADKARWLDVPRVLMAAAVADGCLDALVKYTAQAASEDVEMLAETAQFREEGTSSPGPILLPAKEAKQSIPAVTLPLHDRNGIYLREIGPAEAQAMVNGNHAEPIVSGGWRDRNDLPWEGIRLKMTPELRWSSASLTAADARAVAGEDGSSPRAYAARAKLAAWKFESDTKATRCF